ncbi:MAG TPA: saccharopine dehydrogenase C-terminal domain-containing protein, partial [Polyangiaceae bacterium]|nr:saccharopine dehydrogenase C-terminal domain-containing protein [Polyangiaceae bacterium]
MHRITVLGGGLVGSVMARDLARDDDIHVTVVDADHQRLQRIAREDGARLSTLHADLRDAEQVRNAVRDADAVVGAVPGWLGYQVLEQVIEASKPFVDISFMPQDPRPLDAAARDKGVVGLVDMGVAPGMSNILATRLALDMQKPRDLRIYVGGLPQVRRWPFQYAAVFSPADVIEEYTRPARLIENGQVVTRPALSEIETLDFEGVGTLEAFNSDGLRSLMWTLQVPNMKEKTLRYPGHGEMMRMLRDTGYFAKQSVRVGQVDVRPLDLTLKLFETAWMMPVGEGDVTVMRIEVEGEHEGKSAYFAYDLHDRFDLQTQTTSMARTTGFPCALATRLLLRRQLPLEPGIHFPEAVARHPKTLDNLIEGLRQRGISFQRKTEKPAAATPTTT